MELKLFEYIVAISEERNIARAADKLFLSRSALNRQLLNLENRLGLPLFKRLNNSLKLTYAGEVYIKMAKTILDLEKQGTKHLNDIAESKIGRINLGITQGRALNDFSNLFPKFHEAYPGVNVCLTGGKPDELEELVANGNLDIAVVASGQKFPGLYYQMLSREEVVLAVHKDHPMAHLAGDGQNGEFIQIDLKWFADDNFALMDSGTRIRSITDVLFQHENIKPKVLVDDSLVTLAYNMVKSGICCTILSQAYVKEEDPVVCFALKPRSYLILTMIYREGGYLSRAEKHLISLIDELYNGNTVK
jgi:DNA-binding transcriptional LysR family regulator